MTALAPAPPTPNGAGPPRLSVSSTGLSDASVCLKRYEYHFRDRLTMPYDQVPRAMRVGIWIHRALQDHHTGRDWQKGLAALLGWALAQGLDGQDLQSIYDDVRLTMTSYTRFYDDRRWRVLGAEEEFRTTLGGIELRATNDLRIAGPGDSEALVEHKTTAFIPPPSWRAVDPQTALQTVVARANGHNVQGILFNYLKTGAVVPRVTQKGVFAENSAVTTTAHFEEAVRTLIATRNAAPEGTLTPVADTYIKDMHNRLVDDRKFFVRANVVRSDDLLFGAMRDTAAIVDRLVRADRAGYFPREYHIHTCERYCPYHSVCVDEAQRGSANETLRWQKLRSDDGWREGQL
jgi:PD-(D/E)XK nuclease superfamily